ncbi:MAG: DNA-formamidopyrimidine glycosylase [Cyanobacteria bacterium P01_F01_bin.153]
MPELPEVETVRRGLQRLTLGFVVNEVDALLPRTIAAPESVEGFTAGVVGNCLTGWQRRGKYLLGKLGSGGQGSDRGWLGVHLRMTGQLLWVAPDTPISKHTRVRLLGVAQGETCKKSWELRYVDQRTFGRLWWVPPGVDTSTVMTGLQRLGPEPFSDEFSVDYLRRSLQNRKRSIKSALLDQSLVAGIGNIYADEALFLSGIHPLTQCATLAKERGDRLEKLQKMVVQVLRTSINAGGTTFSDFVGVTGVNGNYGGEAWVYGRDGKPCKGCGATLERLKITGRSSHFCPKCQK